VVDHLIKSESLQARSEEAIYECLLRSAPYTLHPTPYTRHLTPYTLHPTPYSLHLTFHTP